MTFDDAFQLLIANEGDYSNNPTDPGGATRYGVTEVVARARGYTGDMRNLPLDFAKSIYKADYWQDALDGAVAFQVFDAAVNHGVGQAIRFLQRAVGVADDGHIGPVTLGRVNALPVCKVCMLFNAERILFYTKLHTFGTFGEGWMNRVAHNMQLAAKE